MSDEQNQVVENQVTAEPSAESAESAEQQQHEPSAEDVRELAELLRLTRQLRERVLRLAQKCGACDYGRYVESDDPPFHAALRGMEYHLAEAAFPPKAFLVEEMMYGHTPRCVCGGDEWIKWVASGAEGYDAPTCAECRSCGLRIRVDIDVTPPEPKQERGCTRERPRCTCGLCGDVDIPF